jgi:hypothetical protein
MKVHASKIKALGGARSDFVYNENNQMGLGNCTILI